MLVGLSASVSMRISVSEREENENEFNDDGKQQRYACFVADAVSTKISFSKENEK